MYQSALILILPVNTSQTQYLPFTTQRDLNTLIAHTYLKNEVTDNQAIVLKWALKFTIQ